MGGRMACACDSDRIRNHVSSDGRLGDLDPEHEQFAVNVPRSPCRNSNQRRARLMHFYSGLLILLLRR